MTEVEGALLLLEVLKQLGEICCENLITQCFVTMCWKIKKMRGKENIEITFCH